MSVCVWTVTFERGGLRVASWSDGDSEIALAEMEVGCWNTGPLFR